MSEHPPAGENHARWETRLTTLEHRLDELTSLLELVAGQLQPPAGAGVRGAPWSWLTPTNTTTAVEELRTLTEWVSDVYLAYPDAVLPSCWLWHPSLVEELRWLRHTHREAYTTGGWWAVADWHTRYRPDTATRVRTSYGRCELREHTPTGSQHITNRSAPLTEHTSLIATSWSQHRQLPSPTTEQLLEADLADNHDHTNGTEIHYPSTE
jgi:hypothetical protein